jgi:hypothetical protein
LVRRAFDGKICEETTEEVILMKNADRRVIGFELLHYHPAEGQTGIAVETVVRVEP